MPTIYRVDNPNGVGLWFTSEGKKTDFITQIESAKNRDLPMDFDPDFAGGWISAAESIEQLRQWIPFEDMIVLAEHGFVLTEIEVPEIRVVPHHLLFRREHAVIKTLDFNVLQEAS